MAEVLAFLDVYFTAPIYASQDPTRSSYHSLKKRGHRWNPNLLFHEPAQCIE